MNDIKERCFLYFYEQAAPFLPESLISRESRQRIAGLTELLPGELALRTYGFECPLYRPGQADFLVSTSVRRGGPELLSGCSGWRKPGAETMPGLDRVEEFGRIWRAREGNEVALDDVWLEYDLIEARNAIPAPGIFFSPYLSNPTPGVEGSRILAEFMADLQACLNRRPVPPGLENLLFSLLERLGVNTESGLRFMCGVMLGRQDDRTRLVLAMENIEEVLGLLRAAGWPGDYSHLETCLAIWYGLADRVWLNIDLADTAGGKLGFEMSFRNRRSPARESRWIALFDYLEKQELCTADQRESLIRYPGYSLAQTGDAPDSGNLSLPASYWVRNLYHIKIVYEPDGGLKAKAYLSVSHYCKW